MLCNFVNIPNTLDTYLYEEIVLRYTFPTVLSTTRHNGSSLCSRMRFFSLFSRNAATSAFPFFCPLDTLRNLFVVPTSSSCKPIKKKHVTIRLTFRSEGTRWLTVHYLISLYFVYNVSSHERWFKQRPSESRHALRVERIL